MNQYILHVTYKPLRLESYSLDDAVLTTFSPNIGGAFLSVFQVQNSYLGTFKSKIPNSSPKFQIAMGAPFQIVLLFTPENLGDDMIQF